MNVLKLVLGLPFVCALLFFACRSGSEPVSLVAVGLHQSTRIASNVVIQVDSIQDSRCPVNFNCLVAGQARVKLTLSKESESSSVWLTLGFASSPVSTSTRRSDSTNVVLKSAAYKVILQKVDPYPGAGIPGQLHTAFVEVTNL